MTRSGSVMMKQVDVNSESHTTVTCHSATRRLWTDEPKFGIVNVGCEGARVSQGRDPEREPCVVSVVSMCEGFSSIFSSNQHRTDFVLHSGLIRIYLAYHQNLNPVTCVQKI